MILPICVLQVKPAEDFNDKAAKARASELKAACDGLGELAVSCFREVSDKFQRP